VESTERPATDSKAEVKTYEVPIPVGVVVYIPVRFKYDDDLSGLADVPKEAVCMELLKRDDSEKLIKKIADATKKSSAALEAHFALLHAAHQHKKRCIGDDVRVSLFLHEDKI